MNAIGFFGWWMNAHVLRREAQSEKQIQHLRPLHRALVVARGEAVAAPPFGQSLFAVLRKP